MSRQDRARRKRFRKDVYICHYCGAKANSMDHIVPKARGGKDGMYNLQPSCRQCNEAKADDWPTCQCEKCRIALERFWEMTR